MKVYDFAKKRILDLPESMPVFEVVTEEQVHGGAALVKEKVYNRGGPRPIFAAGLRWVPILFWTLLPRFLFNLMAWLRLVRFEGAPPPSVLCSLGDLAQPWARDQGLVKGSEGVFFYLMSEGRQGDAMKPEIMGAVGSMLAARGGGDLPIPMLHLCHMTGFELGVPEMDPPEMDEPKRF